MPDYGEFCCYLCEQTFKRERPKEEALREFLDAVLDPELLAFGTVEVCTDCREAFLRWYEGRSN